VIGVEIPVIGPVIVSYDCYSDYIACCVACLLHKFNLLQDVGPSIIMVIQCSDAHLDNILSMASSPVQPG
jgi:hypothetical protein